MMSLFSPFDMYWFVLPLFFLFLCLSLALGYMYKMSSSSSFYSSILQNLGSFFLSLKPKYFNKLSMALFFMVFFVLMFGNLFSVFSFNFPFTSQVSFVFWVALTSWVGLVSFSVFKNFKGFFSHLIPEGTPLGLTFLLFVIELVSSLIRPLTLTVRLVANILAGHLLMSLLSSLVFFFNLTGIFYIGLNLVEMFVALIQAYIFTTMIVLYFSES